MSQDIRPGDLIRVTQRITSPGGGHLLPGHLTRAVYADKGSVMVREWLIDGGKPIDSKHGHDSDRLEFVSRDPSWADRIKVGDKLICLKEYLYGTGWKLGHVFTVSEIHGGGFIVTDDAMTLRPEHIRESTCPVVEPEDWQPAGAEPELKVGDWLVVTGDLKCRAISALPKGSIVKCVGLGLGGGCGGEFQITGHLGAEAECMGGKWWLEPGDDRKLFRRATLSETPVELDKLKPGMWLRVKQNPMKADRLLGANIEPGGKIQVVDTGQFMGSGDRHYVLKATGVNGEKTIGHEGCWWFTAKLLSTLEYCEHPGGDLPKPSPPQVGLKELIRRKLAKSLAG